MRKSISKKQLFIVLSSIIVVAVILLTSLLIIYGKNFNKKTHSSKFFEENLKFLPEEYDLNSLFEIHFVNVGQGDAIIVNCPDGVTLIIDGGTSSKGKGALEKEYLSYLSDVTYNNIIDYMIVTHPHTDHYVFLDDVLENYQVKEIFYNQNEENTATYSEFLYNALNEENAILHEIDKSSYYYKIKGENYQIEIFASGDSAFKKANEPNCMSIFCLINYNGRKIFFTGDAESPTEKWFMDKYSEKDMDIDILKIGHHGSDTSSQEEFLNFLDPEYAIISCDDGSKYGHPHNSTMQKLYTAGIITYRTNLQGNIVLIMDVDGSFGFITQYNRKAQNNFYNNDEKRIVINK